MKANGEWPLRTEHTSEVSFQQFPRLFNLDFNLIFIFADTIWVILSVDEGGTLALTQQLTHFNALGSVIPMSPPLNPFATQQSTNRHEQVSTVNIHEFTYRLTVY